MNSNPISPPPWLEGRSREENIEIPVAKQEVSTGKGTFDAAPDLSRVVKEESKGKVKLEAMVGQEWKLESSEFLHPTVKKEMFVDGLDMNNLFNMEDLSYDKMFVDGSDMDNLSNIMDLSFCKPFDAASDIDQKTHAKPVSAQCASQFEKPQDEHGLSSAADEVDEDDEPYWPLSGKPYFDVILSKSHFKYPHALSLPRKIVPELPSDTLPAVITYCGKKWEMVYNGKVLVKRLSNGWANFVADNNIKAGDGCFFELTEKSPTRIKFRAQILRCSSVFEGVGETSEAPILID